MELHLSTQQKLSALQAAKSNLSTDIFNLLIRMGLDPDTYEHGVTEVSDLMMGEKMRLDSLIVAMDMVEAKLAAM